MKPTAKTKKLISDNHQLLSIKELMDSLIGEATGLPQEVKQSIIQTRDVTWQAFIKEQERKMTA